MKKWLVTLTIAVSITVPSVGASTHVPARPTVACQVKDL
jgi:hypothetical protein